MQNSRPRATLELNHGLHLRQFMSVQPWASTWADPEEDQRFDCPPPPEMVGLRVMYFEGYPADGPEEWEILDPQLYTCVRARKIRGCVGREGKARARVYLT